ncbi:MAG: hypothetical protein R3B90_12560 [Planctomycetaceae bacterium]
MQDALLAGDPNLKDDATFELFRQSQQQAVATGARMAADLAEMYYEGLVEVCVIG